MSVRKTTIYDVASLAGVSIKTVSRVVNKEAGLRETTRAKVEDAIRQLGYAPNSAARGLAASHSFLVGLLYDNPNANYIIDVQNGVLDCCRQEGFDLVIHPCDFDSPAFVDEVVQMCRAARMAGLVLTPPICDDGAFIRRLKKEGIAFVRVAPHLHDGIAPSVYCEDEQAACALTRHMLDLGHADVAIIRGHPAHGASDLRLNGFNQALKERGLSVPESYYQQGWFDFASGRECARSLLALEKVPTAIFACNDDMAAGVVFEAHERGMRVPEDLSVCGFDDSPVARQIWPALTTVRQPSRMMACSAAKVLIDGVRGKWKEFPHHNFRCELVIRQSTGKRGG